MGLLDWLTGSGETPAGNMGQLTDITQGAPVQSYPQFRSNYNVSNILNGFNRSLLGGISALAGDDSPQAYAAYLAQLQKLKGENNSNQLGDMNVEGYRRAQQLTGGVPNNVVGNVVGQQAAPAQSAPTAPPAYAGPQGIYGGAQMQPPTGGLLNGAPQPGGGLLAPQAQPSQGAGAQPLIDMNRLAQQFQIASTTPAMAGMAPSMLSFIEKGAPTGSYVGQDNGLYARPGYMPFVQNESASKAAGSAPYDIMKGLASQAGRAIKLEPGDTATTGFDLLGRYLSPMMGGNGFSPGAAPAGGAPAPAQMGGAQPPVRVAGGGEGPVGTNATGFPTQSMRGPGGSLQAPLTLEGAAMQKTILPEQYKTAAANYQAANNMMGQLDMMDHNVELLNQAGWSSTGTGAQTKMSVFKGLNSLATSAGFGAPFDPAKIASWEDFNKESTRMGFELAKTLGSREAMMIVQQAVAAVPNADNTYLGARVVSSSLRQAAQRQSDYYEFLNDFAAKHGGNTFGADIAFNKQNPVGNYTKTAIANAIPQGAKDLLLSAPDKYKADFEAKYGPGVARFVLGGK
jgi:hypothetical protein